jgi:hypothetical protein
MQEKFKGAGIAIHISLADETFMDMSLSTKWMMAAWLLILFTACGSNSEKSYPQAGSVQEASQVRPEESQTVSQAAAYDSLLPKQGKLTYRDREAWRKIIGWPESCEEAFSATMSKAAAGLKFYSLGSRAYLVEITCTLGAYQGFQVYTYLDERDSPPVARLLTFPTLEYTSEKTLEKTEAQELWGLSVFDSKSRRLTVLNRFRGLGDCGTFATYGFEGEKPVLLEFRAKWDCDGMGAEDPQKWDRISLDD